MSFVTAPASAIPFPGVGALIDLGVIVTEIMEYRHKFGLPLTDSEDFNNLNEEMRKRLVRYGATTAAQVALIVGIEIGLELGAEEVVKYIPFAGTILASAISAGFMTKYLISCINDMEEIALHIWDSIARESGRIKLT